MNANVLEITARKRQNPLGVADPSDFEFSEGPAIDPRLVVAKPLISLYCLDHANRRALFVETKARVDLSQAPFLYQAQYENAVRAIGVPYEALHNLASEISLKSNRLILVYSVGRSGSTLLGAALNALPGVITLSEPDVYTQLVALRGWDKDNEDEISLLVQSCTKLLCKGSEQEPNPVKWVIKPRSFGIELGDLLHGHFAEAKSLFLYRHAESYMVSSIRAFVGNANTPEIRMGIQSWLSSLVPSIANHVHAGAAPLSWASISAMVWLSTVERYMELHKMGMAGMAIRYEDLQAAPRETIRKIIEYCGLSSENMAAVYRVFERDSQAGSALSQENVGQRKLELSEADRIDFARAFQAHPMIKSPDVIVPTTWMRESSDVS